MGLRRDSDGFSLCLVGKRSCWGWKDKTRAEGVKLNKELSGVKVVVNWNQIILHHVYQRRGRSRGARD